jgi:hypothetical protein
MEMQMTKDKKNSSALAALVAAGIGSFVLGVNIVLVEASPNFMKPLFNFYDPVGPLSGKTTVAVLAYGLSWLGLHLWLKGQVVDEKKWLTATFIMIFLSFVLTFPPFYGLFAGAS